MNSRSTLLDVSILKVITIAIVILQAILFSSLPLVQDQNDSAAYYMNVHHKFTGEYVLEERYPSFKKANPVYPFFGYSFVLYIAKMFSTFFQMDWAFVVKCFHFIFHAISALLFIRIAARITGSGTLAYLTGILYLLYFPHLKFANLIMSETYCIFMLALCLYLFFRFLDEKKYRDAIMLYLLCGHLILIKPVFLLIVLPMPIIHWTLIFKKRLNIPSSSAILLLLIFPLCQVIYSRINFNNENIRPGIGRNLWNRVITHDKLIPQNSYHLHLLKDIYDPDREEVVKGSWWNVAEKLSQNGLDEQTTDHYLKKVALDGISQYPWKYFINTFHNSYHNYNFGSVNGWMYCTPDEFKKTITNFNYDKNHSPLVNELLKQSFENTDSRMLREKIYCSLGEISSKTYFLFHNLIVIILFIFSGIIFIYKFFKTKLSNYYIMSLLIWWSGFSIVFGSNLFEYPQSRLILPAVMYVTISVLLLLTGNFHRNTEARK